MKAKNVLKFTIITVFSLLFFSLVFSMESVVYATEGDCPPILGRSTPIPPNTYGTPMNEGVFDFEVYIGASRGCVHEQEAIGQQEFVLKGWVWNTNLGWISLGSFANDSVGSRDDLVEYPSGVTPADFNGVNRGVFTGNIAYSSVIELYEEPLHAGGITVLGELNGYWWGDNTGWISLNCKEYYDSDGGSTHSPCNDSNYRVFVIEIDDTVYLYGYAWSNSVGWINMNGVILELPIIDFSNIRAEIVVNGVPSSNSREGMVYANGDAGYGLDIRFFRGNQNITDFVFNFLNSDGAPRMCPRFNDSRLLDNRPEATSNAPNVELGFMADCNDPTLLQYSRFSPIGYYLNRFLINSANYEFRDGALISRYLVQSLVPAVGNEYLIKGILFDRVSDPITITSNQVDLRFHNPLDLNLRKSSVDIDDERECFMVGLDPFRITIGIPIDFRLCGSFFGNSILSNPKVTLEYENTEGLNQDLDLFFCESCRDEDQVIDREFTLTSFSSYSNKPFQALVQKSEGSEVSTSALSQGLLNLGVGTILEYSFGDRPFIVRRSGPQMNQAFFRIDSVGGAGGVDSRAFTQIGAGAGAGTASRNLIRDNFVKRVFDVVSAGNNKPGCVAPNQDKLFRSRPVQIQQFISSCKPNDNVNLFYLNNTRETRILINYSIISSFFENNASNPKTLVLVGYDIYFNDNIYSDSNNFPSLVLFRNSSGVGGNVYVGSEVTELTGYLYADRSIFSVENLASANTVTATGVPVNPGNTRSFYNEIAFIGRFFAENCVGCALENPPRKGDGSIASDFDEARPFDLSYFRFSSLMVRTVLDEDDGYEYYADCNMQSTWEPVYYYFNDQGRQVVNNPGPNNSYRREDYDPPLDAYCWVPQPGVEQLSSPFLQAQRDADPNFNASDRRAVNFVFKPLSRTPVFTN